MGDCKTKSAILQLDEFQTTDVAIKIKKFKKIRGEDTWISCC